MEMAKVTSKGQITIPVSIRRRLGINEGDKLLFIDNPAGVVMVNPDSLQDKHIMDDAEAKNVVPEAQIDEIDDVDFINFPGRYRSITFDDALPAGDDVQQSDPPPATEANPSEAKLTEHSPAVEAEVQQTSALPADTPEPAVTDAPPIKNPVSRPSQAPSGAKQVRGVDIGSLLDEIRSIGSLT